MKKLTKLVSLVLATALFAGTLAGCGAGGAKTSANGDTFKIGAIGPLTGGAAIYGNAAINGAQIAVDEINANGGINGFQVEFRAEDDVHDAEKSVNAYNSLKDWGMQVLAGTVTTTPCIAVAEKSSADGMLQVTPSASSTEVIVNDNVFQTCFTDPAQGTLSADYISAHFADAKIGVIYNSQEVYSTGVRDTFVAEAAKLGLEILVEEAFTNETNTDFTTQLQKCKDAGVDLIFYPYYYQEATTILTEMNDMDYDAQLFGVDGLDGILTVEGFDLSLAEGVYLLTPFIAVADSSKDFVSKYQEKFGEVPNQFAADGYDTVYVIKAALEAANATPSMSAKEIGDVAIPAMTTISVNGLTGSNMTWLASGEVSKDPQAVIIKDGAYAAVE
jgi:branched-chain amino acid transport system substrate-binding protein